VIVAAIVVVSLLGAHRVALTQLRGAEDDYMAGRALTACASRQLRPFAEEQRSLDELPDALLEIITDARDEARQVLASADDETFVPYPRVGSATAAVRRALEAQVRLYEAMVDDPTNTDDELELLGAANRGAEAQLEGARRLLFVGQPEGWSDRNRCRSN
jgi:hypothetical protein